MPFDPTDPDTKAALDDIKASFEAKMDSEISGLKSKNAELIAANKELKKGREVDPAEIDRLESQIEDLQGKLAASDKAAKEATKAAEKAAQALEAEQGAARSYALDAELNAAVAAGNVAAPLVPAFLAMVKQGAKAELVDGKYVVQIGDKPARDYITGLLDSDDGKHFKAAAMNGGGGAPGGGGSGAGGKTMTRSEYDAKVQSGEDTRSFFKEGGKIVDQAA